MAGIKTSEIIILGKSGQVGHAFAEIIGNNAILLDQHDIDFSNPSEITGKLKDYKARLIINASAYTAVDKAEQEEALAHKINAEAPGIIANYCKKNDIAFVHYSTDYVFPGTGEKPWSENDQTGPQNAYGRTKLAGDEAVAASGAKYLIFRTSWVYDHQGRNFLLTMLKLGKERESLKIVDDQIGAPTYAYHIAKYSWQAINKAFDMDTFPSGVYNLCNSGHTSWCGFAKQIFSNAHNRNMELKIKEVIPIPSSEFPTPAIRPKNSRLNLDKLQEVFQIRMPGWQEALEECMERINEGSQNGVSRAAGSRT